MFTDKQAGLNLFSDEKKPKRCEISGFFLMAAPSVLRSESLECFHNYNLHLLKQITLLCDYSIYSLMQQKNVL